MYKRKGAHVFGKYSLSNNAYCLVMFDGFNRIPGTSKPFMLTIYTLKRVQSFHGKLHGHDLRMLKLGESNGNHL